MMNMLENEKYILFSPVSGSDPASDNGDSYRDGPMLHIVRKYQPQKVYLYLTDYYQPYEQSDHRYSEMVKFVSAGSIVEIVNSDKDIDVHRFDVFDQPFRDILTRIHDENKNAELLLNLSSGTPEMQSALYLVAATLPFAPKPIQVDSPSHGPNYSRVEPRKFDLDIVKEYLNETEERCYNATCQNARRTILKENIEKLVDSFDYAAARELYTGNEQLFGRKTGQLLKAAAAHLAIDEAGLQNSGVQDEYFYEQPDKIKGRQERQCYDYLLYMGSLIERKAYSDFSSALSPALTTVMQIRLCNAGYDIRQFCEEGKDGIVRLKIQKIEEVNNDFMAFLDKEYANKYNQASKHNFKDGVLSAQHMLLYMKYLNKSGVDLDYDNFETTHAPQGDNKKAAAR